jgi:hypothetical protein
MRTPADEYRHQLQTSFRISIAIGAVAGLARVLLTARPNDLHFLGPYGVLAFGALAFLVDGLTVTAIVWLVASVRLAFIAVRRQIPLQIGFWVFFALSAIISGGGGRLMYLRYVNPLRP